MAKQCKGKKPKSPAAKKRAATNFTAAPTLAKKPIARKAAAVKKPVYKQTARRLRVALPAPAAKSAYTVPMVMPKPPMRMPVPPKIKAMRKTTAGKKRKRTARKAAGLTVVTRYKCKPGRQQAIEYLTARGMEQDTSDAFLKLNKEQAALVQADLATALGAGDHHLTLVYDGGKDKLVRATLDKKPAPARVRDVADLFALKVYLRDMARLAAGKKV